MTFSNKQIAFGAGALIVLVGVGFAVARSVNAPSGDIVPSPVSTETQGTSTPETPIKPAAETFPLPVGAVSIDEYAYANDSKIYFRPVTKRQASLPVENADAATFARVGAVASYTSPGAVAECGGSARYAFYADVAHAYLYQVWDTATFRASQVDYLPGLFLANLRVDASGVASDGKDNYVVGYAQTGTTCRLHLTRTSI